MQAKAPAFSYTRAFLWSLRRSFLLLPALGLFPSLALAADLLQPDAAAPGMSVVVHVLSSAGLYTGNELITTSCPDILVGPSYLSDGTGDPGNPVVGAVLSAVFFVSPSAALGDCTISVDGAPLVANGGIDNLFRITTALPGPVDGGTGDADGTVNGEILLASTDRSDGGTLLLQSLSVPLGTTLRLDTTDPLGSSPGNEAYLPLVLLVEGDVDIAGDIDLSGKDGGIYGTGNAAAGRPGDGGDGGDAGPGGGGGGGGGPNGSTSTTGYGGAGGDGLAGGSAGTSSVLSLGGSSPAESAATNAGSDNPFAVGGGDGAVNSYCNGGPGGSGNLWGTGGGSSADGYGVGGGGYGGGGGSGTLNVNYGGTGGGFATAGASGAAGYGGGGLANGESSLRPLAGGSGGGGGDGWIGSYINNYAGGGGGGGGGALRLSAWGSLSVTGGIWADGGGGGNAAYVYASGGGGGAGGAISLASPALSITGSLSAMGGVGGSSTDAADLRVQAAKAGSAPTVLLRPRRLPVPPAPPPPLLKAVH